MRVDSPITPVFCTLPKIHKALVDTPPGRPIVAATGSLTEKVSAFVDYSIQASLTNLPTYTRHSMDLIKTIQSIKLTNTQRFFVTMDTESLYTNVTFEGGLQAAKSFLEKKKSCADFYLQESRVAVGSKMSPSFASLNMGLFECEMIFNQELNPYLHHISHWKHYFMCL